MTKGFSWSSLFYLVLLLCPYRGGKEGWYARLGTLHTSGLFGTGSLVTDGIERPGAAPDANYVAAVVPRGFGAYARLFHPAYLDTKPISWSLVAELSGRFSHALMQWHSISVFPATILCSAGFSHRC